MLNVNPTRMFSGKNNSTFPHLRGFQVLSVVASQVKCVQDAVGRLSNPDLRELKYQHLPAGTPNVKVI